MKTEKTPSIRFYCDFEKSIHYKSKEAQKVIKTMIEKYGKTNYIDHKNKTRHKDYSKMVSSVFVDFNLDNNSMSYGFIWDNK